MDRGRPPRPSSRQAKRSQAGSQAAGGSQAREGRRGSRQGARWPARPSRAPGHPGPQAASKPGRPSKPARGTKLNIPLYLSQREEFSTPQASEHNMCIPWRVEITFFYITCSFISLDQNSKMHILVNKESVAHKCSRILRDWTLSEK